MPAGPASFSGASLVMMARDAPLTVEQIEELTKILPDGKAQTRTIERKIYRDQVGRFRTETKAPDPLSEIISLADPVEGFIAILVPSAKIAHRFVPPTADRTLGLGFTWPGLQMGGKDRKMENIGKLTIEGIEFEGIRTTVTSDSQPPVVTIDERWMCNELGLIGRVEDTSPTERYSARIKTVSRKDPDPELFVIPADYAIRELEQGIDHPLK